MSKRPHNVVDLTGSSPVGPRSKQPRTAASSSQAYAGSSSQASSSRRPGHGPASTQERQRLAYQLRDPFDDEPDLVDLTQADEGPVFGLYGTIDNKIVGVRHYNGIVSPGEIV